MHSSCGRRIKDELRRENYWVPIPQSEIDNNPRLVQLPLWDTTTEVN